MLRIRLILVLATFLTLLSAAAHSAADETSAPLGLHWGMSSSEAKAAGVQLTALELKDYGDSFEASKLPRVIADAAGIVLSFGFDDKLWRIVIVSRPFGNDPYGRAVRQRYDELASVLAEKYGRGEQHQWLGDAFYSKPENFVYAIKSGNAWWYTDYHSSEITAQLAIRAVDMSSTTYQVIFENNALRANFEKSKSTREKGSL